MDIATFVIISLNLSVFVIICNFILVILKLILYVANIDQTIFPPYQGGSMGGDGFGDDIFPPAHICS